MGGIQAAWTKSKTFGTSATLSSADSPSRTRDSCSMTGLAVSRGVQQLQNLVGVWDLK